LPSTFNAASPSPQPAMINAGLKKQATRRSRHVVERTRFSGGGVKRIPQKNAHVRRFDIDHLASYLFPVNTITVSSKFQIVIPKEVREKLQIQPGARLQVVADGSGLRLQKEPTLADVRRLLKGMQWTEPEVRDESDRLMS